MGSESFNLPQKFKPETSLESGPVADDLIDAMYGNSEEVNTSESENVLTNEIWDAEKALVEYTARNEDVARRLFDVEDKLNSLHLVEDDINLDKIEIDTLITERYALQQEKIAASANYPGDWTNLLHQRLTDPATKEKFTLRRTEAMEYMADDVSKVGRREKPKAHYLEQITNYEENIAKVFSRTEVGTAEDFGGNRRSLGNMGKKGLGVVFLDAEQNGSPLSNRQKNIIEAHEKGHCLRDFASPYDQQEIQSAVDRNIISELNVWRQANGLERIAPTYVSNPMEIAERMAQFKNYFGMGAHDKFEKSHLDYVRKHYVADTGLDNGVSDLLYVVTPETEAAFLDVINKYPI